MSPTRVDTRTVNGAMPDPWNRTSVTDGDALANYPQYRGEWAMPRSVTPSPPQTQEITISGSARNTQFPILVGNTRVTGDLMGTKVTTSPGTFWYLAYRIGEAPPGGLSSITNIKINGEDVSEGTGAVNTGLSWCYYCNAHLGAQNQAVDSTFSGVSFGSYAWTQRHQGTAWIALIIDYSAAPNMTSVPVVTCEFDAGSINDWDGSSRSLSNPATAAYYLLSSERFGLDAAAASFNSTEWDAWADFCDASLSGEARWTVNGAITGQSFRDALQLVLKHGFGAVWYWGDEWHVGYMKTHAAAAATATNDDFTRDGGFSFTNVSRSKLPNRVFAWFKDETNERDDCRVSSASDLTPANCRETQARLELCTSASMAQRWAATYLGVCKEESRVGRGILHPGIAKNLAPYERLDITSNVGVSASEWRVTGVRPVAGGCLEVDVRQYSSTALSTATSDTTPSAGGPELGDDVERFMYAGNIEDGNYVSIDTSGNLSLVGDATVWEDLRFAAQNLGRLGNSDPDFVKVADSDGEGGSTGVYGLGFDDSTLQEVVFAVQFPHEWKEESNVTFHVHWAPATSTGSLEKGVVWALEYSWCNIGAVDGTGAASVFPNTTTIYATDSGVLTAFEHRMVNFSAITATSKKISSMMLCRLYRAVSNSNDDYADDAILLEADFHYEIDSMGSKTISAK